MVARRFLILDAPEGALAPLSTSLRRAAGADGSVEVVATPEELLSRLRGGRPYDLVVVGVDAGGGRDTIKRARELGLPTALIAVAERGGVEVAERAIMAGASDFLVLGPKLAARVRTLLSKVRQQLALIDENRLLAEQNRLLRADRHQDEIVGDSPQVQEVRRRIERVAKIPRPVLITGERGTGKELVARAIHARAGPPDRPMVSVNCAAFADTLLESELFGHEKGAFTGADGVAQGRFEQASGGTLFLDEVGNMSPAFQQKVLRVLEYGAFRRVGGATERRTTARVIAATNVDLEARIAAGTFLPDLHDRLAFEVIRVPSLREREGDIEVLARHFLRRFADEIPALAGKRLSPAALALLRRHPFPGNVRELKNVIERAAYQDTEDEVGPDDLGLAPSEARRAADERGSLHERVEAFERRLVHEALRDADGNQAEAARRLGISYHQLRYLLRKHAT
jgi:DNA-binding NtrC family response regulator